MYDVYTLYTLNYQKTCSPKRRKDRPAKFTQQFFAKFPHECTSIEQHLNTQKHSLVILNALSMPHGTRIPAVEEEKPKDKEWLYDNHRCVNLNLKSKTHFTLKKVLDKGLRRC